MYVLWLITGPLEDRKFEHRTALTTRYYFYILTTVIATNIAACRPLDP